jgi:hypothetical protein
LTVASSIDRTNGRGAVAGALVAPLLFWLTLGANVLFNPSLSNGDRSHIGFGLIVFAIIIIGPMVLLLATLNWAARRVVAFVCVFSFVNMARAGTAQGFGVAADWGMVAIFTIMGLCVLFFLSRPALMSATGDYYNFLSIRDIMSKNTFHRKIRQQIT